MQKIFSNSIFTSLRYPHILKSCKEVFCNEAVFSVIKFSFLGGVTFFNPALAKTQTVSTTEELTSALGDKDIDTITVKAGSTIKGKFTVNRTVKIAGASGEKPILDANGAGRVLTVTDEAAVTLENLVLQNGGGEQFGGGLRLDSGTATVTDCDFKDNAVTQEGGAVYMENDTSVAFTNCTFTGNHSGSEGGVILGHGSLTLENCTFTDNRSGGHAGAIYAYGSLTAKNCVFKNNSSVSTEYTNDAGAIETWNNCPSLILEGCSFEGNACSEKGGALRLYGGSDTKMTITDCDFTGNECKGAVMNNTEYYGEGGAIYVMGKGNLTVRNCTFVDNGAAAAGGNPGTGGAVDWLSSGTLTLVNCVFTGNSAGSGTDPLLKSAGGAIYRYDGDIRAIHCTFADNSAEEGPELYASNTTIVNSVIYNSGSSSIPAIHTGQEKSDAPQKVVTLDNCAAASSTLNQAGVDATGCKTISSWDPKRVTFKRANGHTATAVQTTGATTEGGAALTGKALSAVASEHTVDKTYIEKDMTGRDRDANAPELGAVSSGEIPEPDKPQVTPPVIQSFTLDGVSDSGILIVGTYYKATATATGENVTWNVEADKAITAGTPSNGNTTTFTVLPNAVSDAAGITVIARNDGGSVNKTLTFKVVATQEEKEEVEKEIAANELSADVPAADSDAAKEMKSELGGEQIYKISSDDIKSPDVDVNGLDSALQKAVSSDVMSPLYVLPQLKPARTGIYVFKLAFDAGKSGTLHFFPGEGGTVNGQAVSVASVSTEGRALFYTDATYKNQVTSVTAADTSVVVAAAFEKGTTYTPVVAVSSSPDNPDTPTSNKSSGGCDAGLGGLALLCGLPLFARKRR